MMETPMMEMDAVDYARKKKQSQCVEMEQLKRDKSVMTKEFIMEMDVINTAKKSLDGIVEASLLFVR